MGQDLDLSGMKPFLDLTLIGAAVWAFTLCVESPMFDLTLESAVCVVLLALMLYTEWISDKSIFRSEKPGTKIAMHICLMGSACWAATLCISAPMFEPNTELVVSSVFIVIMLFTELTFDDYVVPLLPLLLKLKPLIGFIEDVHNNKVSPENLTARNLKEAFDWLFIGAASWFIALIISTPMFEVTCAKIMSCLFVFLMIVAKLTSSGRFPLLLPLLSKSKSYIESVEDYVNNNRKEIS